MYFPYDVISIHFNAALATRAAEQAVNKQNIDTLSPKSQNCERVSKQLQLRTSSIQGATLATGFCAPQKHIHSFTGHSFVRKGKKKRNRFGMFDLKFAFLLNFLKKKMKEATYQGFLEDICLF